MFNQIEGIDSVKISNLGYHVKSVTRKGLLTKCCVTFWLNFFMHGWAQNAQVVEAGKPFWKDSIVPVETNASSNNICTVFHRKT